MDNFRVLATDERPPAPSTYNLLGDDYRLCGVFDGTPLASSSSTVECQDANAIGRYVYISLSKKEYLQACEVFVYGSRE